MLNSVFPIGSNWSWNSFFLYILVSLCVCFFCKNGASLNARFNSISFNYWYCLSFILLLLLACLRSLDVGTDTSKYVDYFLRVDSFSYDFSQFFSFHEKEPGYKLLMYCIRSFTDNYTILFLIVYSIVSFAYILYIKFFYDNNSDYLFLSLFIFFFFCNMSGMRSALGQAFILFSFIFLSQRLFLAAFIVTLIAISFHYTMMYNLYIVLFVLLFSNYGIIKRKSFWFAGIAILLILSNIFISKLNLIFADTKYSYYSTENVSDLSFVGSMIFVLLGIVSVIYINQICQKDSKLKTLFIITWSFLLTYPMLVVTGAYRIPNYYAMPRLSIWSACFQQYQLSRMKYNDTENVFVRILMFFILLAYLLMRFSKASLDGGFIYYIR